MNYTAKEIINLTRKQIDDEDSKSLTQSCGYGVELSRELWNFRLWKIKRASVKKYYGV
jgi:hypothetical protein